MQQKTTPQNFQEAQEYGYTCDFVTDYDGRVTSASAPFKSYSIREFRATAITELELKRTIYLIITFDGLMGNIIEYWETF